MGRTRIPLARDARRAIGLGVLLFVAALVLAAKAEGADRCLARADQKRGRKLAEAIDKILEQRRKGVPSECATTIANRTD